MTVGFTFDFNTIVGIATILGATATCIALYPLLKPYLQRLEGKISEVSGSEATYLKSLAKDLEHGNQKNCWSNKFYVNVDTELQDRGLLYDIPPAFYIVKSINRHLKEQDFNNLNNVEKIDSSRGRTFNSLESALDDAQDNAVVVIAPPGSGKTVSLRNLAINKVEERISRKTNLIPIFINLGYFTGFKQDGSIKEFDVFLDEFFSASSYYKYLANRHWETLLKEGKCVFFLDGIDELPRRDVEYEDRSQKIANFAHSWPNTQFILSCREIDYNRELSFQQILIKPFDRKHIESYMKKYFSKKEYKAIFHQIEESPGIYGLCGNPFYLDLVCYFSKFEKKIPENKAQLFNFIIHQFMGRENRKQTIEANKDDFILAMSHLGYYLAIEKMVTTIKIDEYIHSLQKHKHRELFVQMIEYAIKGDLLEFNQQSQEIRFIHNRFQEFFSSYYILRNYRDDISILPENAFTNIWWKETNLFIAGLDNEIDDFIEMILKRRDKFADSNKFVEELLKIEMTILAFECILGNLNFNNKSLYEKVRGSLMQYYSEGVTLVKAKVLSAFRYDQSDEVKTFLQRALGDESLWVSERAFFILSDGQLKMQLNSLSIIKEFFKFFIEGRILNTFGPILKNARRSGLIQLLLPLYFLLIIGSFFSIAVVGYVFYSFFEYIIFKLEYAFTSECLGCLFSISLGSYIILYCLMRNNYPVLKKFIYVVPLVLMIRYIVFNTPDNIFFKYIIVGTGWLSYILYRRYLKKPIESNWSLGSIYAFIFGYSLLIPVFNFETIANLVYIELSLSPDTHPVNDKIMPFISLIGLAIVLVLIIIHLYREVGAIGRLNHLTNKIDAVLSQHGDEQHKILIFAEMLESLSLIWTQKILLKRILDRMTTFFEFSREQKMLFLSSLAKLVSSLPFRDAIYQQLEEEENNYRRLIKR